MKTGIVFRKAAEAVLAEDILDCLFHGIPHQFAPTGYAFALIADLSKAEIERLQAEIDTANKLLNPETRTFVVKVCEPVVA